MFFVLGKPAIINLFKGQILLRSRTDQNTLANNFYCPNPDELFSTLTHLTRTNKIVHARHSRSDTSSSVLSRPTPESEPFVNPPLKQFKTKFKLFTFTGPSQ